MKTHTRSTGRAHNIGRLLKCWLAISAAAAASSARADLSTINGNWGADGAGTEWNLYDSGVGTAPGTGLLEYLYGAGRFTRVDDSSDRIWFSNGNGKAGVTGVYAGASENLYTTDLGGGNALFIVNPVGTIGLPPQRFVAGSEVAFIPASQPFLFLDNAVYYTAAYSDPSFNADIDRMVTFAVSGYLATPGDANSWTPFGDGTIHYVIGFDDYNDFDYQDLVVEVSGVAPVPEPQAWALLAVFAATFSVLRRRIRGGTATFRRAGAG